MIRENIPQPSNWTNVAGTLASIVALLFQLFGAGETWLTQFAICTLSACTFMRMKGSFQAKTAIVMVLMAAGIAALGLQTMGMARFRFSDETIDTWNIFLLHPMQGAFATFGAICAIHCLAQHAKWKLAVMRHKA